MRPPDTLDYSPAPSSTYQTTPGVSPSGNSTHMAERREKIAQLVVGQIVSIKAYYSPVLRGKVGVIVVGSVEYGFPDSDCLVLLDGRDRPLGFYWYELNLLKRRPMSGYTYMEYL